jgi:hypothetical protein
MPERDKCPMGLGGCNGWGTTVLSGPLRQLLRNYKNHYFFEVLIFTNKSLV